MFIWHPLVPVCLKYKGSNYQLLFQLVWGNMPFLPSCWCHVTGGGVLRIICGWRATLFSVSLSTTISSPEVCCIYKPGIGNLKRTFRDETQCSGTWEGFLGRSSSWTDNKQQVYPDNRSHTLAKSNIFRFYYTYMYTSGWSSVCLEFYHCSAAVVFPVNMKSLICFAGLNLCGLLK